MARYKPAAARDTKEESCREAARRYIKDFGWKPLPVSRGNKGPKQKGWPEWPRPAADAAEAYVKEHWTMPLAGVAVQLGAMSGGLTDIDLDCPEAVALAPEFLPATQAVFGRASKRRSHHFYITDLHTTERRATLPFAENDAMLVELRCGGDDKGAATLVPPSVHPSGETVTWDADGAPAEVSGQELKEQVALLAAACLLVRHYPPQTKRHVAALVLGGVLARAKWPEDNIAWFVGAIAEAAADEEIKDRIDSATSAVKHLADGEDTPGLPRMREEWGEGIVDLFAEWIDYDAGTGNTTAKNAGTTGPSAKGTQTGLLLALADDANLFHSREGVCYADVEANGHRETHPLGTKGSGGFAVWLRHRFYDATGSAPNPQALTAALNTLTAKARYDGDVREVYVRCAAVGDRVYVDLGDENWSIIEIDAQGWRFVTDAPVRFLHRRGMLPLPQPVPDHSLETRRAAIDKLFDDYVNVATGNDFALLVSVLLAALSGRGPYPVLVLLGEAGAAKSTAERVLKALIDPNKAPLRAPPREARDMFVAANNSYLIAFDNLSDLPGWLSDMLCRLSTGGGFGTRQLYTDEDEMLFDAMRPVVLTAIDNIVVRGDLTDRGVFLTLRPIPEEERKHEREFWAAFERDKPTIFGALLDIVAAGLRELPHVKLDKAPRMADFAEWATACEAAAEDALWPVGTFARAYALNRAHATTAVIEEDLVADAIYELMKNADEWVGDTAALLENLNKRVGETVQKNKYWPKATNALARRMNKVAGVLRKIGIEIKAGSYKHTNRRKWTIKHQEANSLKE